MRGPTRTRFLQERVAAGTMGLAWLAMGVFVLIVEWRDREAGGTAVGLSFVLFGGFRAVLSIAADPSRFEPREMARTHRPVGRVHAPWRRRFLRAACAAASCVMVAVGVLVLHHTWGSDDSLSLMLGLAFLAFGALVGAGAFASRTSIDDNFGPE